MKDNPELAIGFLVTDVARLMRRAFERRSEELGLSQTQLKALAYLSREEGVKQVTLAEQMEIQPITLARAIDRLEEAGLVVRRRDPRDRRAFRLYLTPDAEGTLDQVWAIAASLCDEVLGEMPKEQFTAMTDALNVLKRSLLKFEKDHAGDAGASKELQRETARG